MHWERGAGLHHCMTMPPVPLLQPLGQTVLSACLTKQRSPHCCGSHSSQEGLATVTGAAATLLARVADWAPLAAHERCQHAYSCRSVRLCPPNRCCFKVC